eukprot:1195420-Prorocentrum_minimum.AAC.2
MLRRLPPHARTRAFTQELLDSSNKGALNSHDHGHWRGPRGRVAEVRDLHFHPHVRKVALEARPPEPSPVHLPIAAREAVYTQSENQSQQGRRYIPGVRTNCSRGGGIYPAHRGTGRKWGTGHRVRKGEGSLGFYRGVVPRRPLDAVQRHAVCGVGGVQEEGRGVPVQAAGVDHHAVQRGHGKNDEITIFHLTGPPPVPKE